MAHKIFVTATNTEIGKTHSTLLLMEEAAQQGMRPGAFKPIETGVGPTGPCDGNELLHAMQRLNPVAAALGIETIVPATFSLPAAPYVANEGKEIQWSPILERFEMLCSVCDIVFIEGAGGLLVPIDENCFMIDLAEIFTADTTLLIAPAKLGSINDTLLSLEALEKRQHPWHLAINLKEEEKGDFQQLTRPYYDRTHLPYFTLPKERHTLLHALIGQ